MGLFENIVENVLCEISANDAYEKFYSKIPKETFDQIVNAYGGKFDAFIKLLLSGIIDGSLTGINSVLHCIKCYKGIENKARIYISNKIKNKEYSDASELYYDVISAYKGKIQIISPKELYTNGLVTVAENDKWKITCTLNYQASHHFYGNSKWCTASDRFGRYDGFEFFSKYITDLNGSWDDDKWDEPDNEAICCLIQFVDKSNMAHTMQAQINLNGDIETVCDFNDEELDEEILVSVFEQENNIEIYNELKKQIPNLINLTNEQRKIELKYELSRNDYVHAKREEMDRRRNLAYLQKKNEAERLNTEQNEKVVKCFNEVIEKKLYLNVDFLNSLHNSNEDIFEIINDFDEDIYNGVDSSQKEEFKNLYKIITDNYFIMKYSMKCLSNYSDYYILRLETVQGLDYLAYDFDTPVVAVNLSTERFYSENNGFIYLLVKSEDGSRINSVIKEIEKGIAKTIPSIRPLKEAFSQLDSNFDNYYIYEEYNTDKAEFDTNKIVSLVNNKSIDINGQITGYEYIFEGTKEFLLVGYKNIYDINLESFTCNKFDIFKAYIEANFSPKVFITTDGTVFYTKSQRSLYVLKTKFDFQINDNLIYRNYGVFEHLAGNSKEYIYILPDLKNPLFECKRLIIVDEDTIYFYSLGNGGVFYEIKDKKFYRKSNNQYINCDMYGNDINQGPTMNESFVKMKNLYKKNNRLKKLNI